MSIAPFCIFFFYQFCIKCILDFSMTPLVTKSDNNGILTCTYADY